MRYIFSILFVIVFLLNIQIPVRAQETINTEKKIQNAIDLVASGLTEDGKSFLIHLLHDDIDNEFNMNIRLVLSAICYQEEDFDCVMYHWDKIINEAPESKEAKTVRDLKSHFEFFASTSINAWNKDIGFLNELLTSRRFWTYQSPDYKMKWEDLKDPYLAIEYINNLITKYESDSPKLVILLFEKFLLTAGYNMEDYGFLSTKVISDKNERKRLKDFYLQSCIEISKVLKDIPGGESFYIHSQFLLGVMTSGHKFLSSKIKLNEQSAFFFHNVLKATEGDLTNPYRIFSSIWLEEYYKKIGNGNR